MMIRSVLKRLLLLLAIVTILLGCGGSDGPNDASDGGAASKDDLSISFNWAMADRFGLPDDGNAIVVENTVEYASAHKFEVTLNFSTNPGMTTEAEAVSQSLDWSVLDAQGVEAARGSDEVATVELAEGAYRVDVVAVRGSERATKRFDLTVEDILMVAIGDSFISGEGNPHTARDGDQSAGWARSTDDNAMTTHAAARRSIISFAAQAAAVAEQADARTSVTFVFVAASGATISEGLLQEQREPCSPHAGFRSDADGSSVLDAGSQLQQVTDLIGGRQIDSLMLSIGSNDVGFQPGFVSLVVDEDRHIKDELEGLRRAVNTGDYSPLIPAEVTTLLDNFADLVPFVCNLERPRAGFGRLDAELAELAAQVQRLAPRHVYVIGYPDPTTRVDLHGLDSRGAIAFCGIFAADVLNGWGIRPVESDFLRRGALQPLNNTLSQASHAYGWSFIPTATLGNGYCAAPYRINKPYLGAQDSAGPNAQNWPARLLHQMDAAGYVSHWRNARESTALQGPDALEVCRTILNICRDLRGTTTGLFHPNELGHARVADLLLATMAEEQFHLYEPTTIWLAIVHAGRPEPDDWPEVSVRLDHDAPPGLLKLFEQTHTRGDVCYVWVDALARNPMVGDGDCDLDDVKSLAVGDLAQGTVIRIYEHGDGDIAGSWLEIESTTDGEVAAIPRLETTHMVHGTTFTYEVTDDRLSGEARRVELGQTPMRGNPQILDFIDEDGRLVCRLIADIDRGLLDLGNEPNHGCDDDKIASVRWTDGVAGSVLHLGRNDGCSRDANATWSEIAVRTPFTGTVEIRSVQEEPRKSEFTWTGRINEQLSGEVSCLWIEVP